MTWAMAGLRTVAGEQAQQGRKKEARYGVARHYHPALAEGRLQLRRAQAVRPAPQRVTGPLPVVGVVGAACRHAERAGVASAPPSKVRTATQR